MIRKKSSRRFSARKIWPLILTCFCTLAIPVTHVTAQADKREIVRQASQSYYSLRRLGLLEFKANVQPNWTLLARSFEPNPEAMKLLNGLTCSVSLKPDGSVKVDQESSLPISSDQEENVKQMRAGIDEILRGFFMSWNVFMLTSPFPAVDSDYELQGVDGKYLLTHKEGNTVVYTTMTKEFAVEEIRVSSAAFEGSVKTQLAKTPKGYVLVGYSYDQISGPVETKLTVQVDYQEITGLQLPRKLSLDIVKDGSLRRWEFQFSQYQLKTR